MNFEEISIRWQNWSVITFEKATMFSSLDKLITEIDELHKSLITETPHEQLNEYADCFLCLLHSAAKAGFNPQQIIQAMENKCELNYKRKWVLNEDGNTYSHLKYPNGTTLP